MQPDSRLPVGAAARRPALLTMAAALGALASCRGGATRPGGQPPAVPTVAARAIGFRFVRALPDTAFAVCLWQDPATGDQVLYRCDPAGVCREICRPPAGCAVDFWAVGPSATGMVVALTPPSYPPTGDANDLWLVGHGSGAQRALTHDRAGYSCVRWRDDRSIAYLSQMGTTYVTTAEGPPPRPVPWTVYVQDVRTGERRAVFRERPGAYPHGRISSGHYLEWISNSGWLLYISARPRGLFAIDADTGRTVRLLADPPDGFWVRARAACWLTGSRLLQVLRLPQSPALLTRRSSWHRPGTTAGIHLPTAPDYVTFSPAGRQAAAVLHAPGSSNGQSEQLALLELSSRRTDLVDRVPAASSDTRWTPDGRFVVWHEQPSGGEGRAMALPARTGRRAPRPGRASARAFVVARWRPAACRQVELVETP